MQPLGGKTRNGKGSTGGFWRRGSRTGEKRRTGIFLNMSGSWQGRSQKPGGRRSRGWLPVRVPVSWRVATASFVAAAAIYGLSEGGYFDRSARFATKKASTLVTRAGFAVNRVTIEGQDRTKDKEIIHALGLDKTTSMLFTTYAGMGPFDFVINRFADIMKKT